MRTPDPSFYRLWFHSLFSEISVTVRNVNSSLALLQYMFPSLGDHCSYMVVRQRIKHGFSYSSVLYQTALFQDPKLMGNCRLGHIQRSCQITDTHLCFKKNKQDPDSGRISENLKKLCQRIQFMYSSGIVSSTILKAPHEFPLYHSTDSLLFLPCNFPAFPFYHITCRDFLHGYYNFFTNSARMAFRTAITITPTSAKIAIHIFAIPTAPRSRHRILIPIAK